MKVTYECGDVFKDYNNEYYIIGGTDNGFKLISLKNGFGYDFECNTEKEITEYINNEGFEYIGRAEDVISIVYKSNIVKNDCESNYNPTFKHSYVRWN